VISGESAGNKAENKRFGMQRIDPEIEENSGNAF
jgi:hypothetical protein